MACEEGVSAGGVAQRLGLSAGIISRWKRQLKNQGDGAFPGTGRLPYLTGTRRSAICDVS